MTKEKTELEVKNEKLSKALAGKTKEHAALVIQMTEIDIRHKT